MEVECRDIVGFEKYYQVSRDGRIFSKGRTGVRKNGWIMNCRPMELVQKDNGRGYMTVMLYDEHKGHRFYVHRLVAKAFVDNPYNLPQVNHKDENKSNNNADNLEWCDARYNLTYGTHIERVVKANSRPVIQYTINWEYVAEYPSAMEAMRQTGIKQGTISQCCKGQKQTAGGYKWKLKY